MKIISWAYFLPKTSQATICFPRIFRRGFFSKSYFQILRLSWLLGFFEEQVIQITVVNDRDSMLINSNCTKNIDHLHQPTISHKIFLKKYAYSPLLHPRYSMLRCWDSVKIVWNCSDGCLVHLAGLKLVGDCLKFKTYFDRDLP